MDKNTVGIFFQDLYNTWFQLKNLTHVLLKTEKMKMMGLCYSNHPRLLPTSEINSLLVTWNEYMKNEKEEEEKKPKHSKVMQWLDSLTVIERKSLFLHLYYEEETDPRLRWIAQKFFGHKVTPQLKQNITDEIKWTKIHVTRIRHVRWLDSEAVTTLEGCSTRVTVKIIGSYVFSMSKG